MTEADHRRWGLSTIRETIEDFSLRDRPEDNRIAHVLEDITSPHYVTYAIEGDEIDPGSVMHGMLYATQGRDGLDFDYGVVSLAPNITTEQLKPRFRGAIDELTASWSPVRRQTYLLLQQIVQERHSFRTLAAMIVAHGITENGSTESVLVAFPSEYRRIIELPTERERNTSGIFFAGSFLKRIAL